MAKLKLDTEKLTKAIAGLVPDTLDRVLLSSEYGKVEITAEYDEEDGAYYVLTFNRVATTVFSSSDIWDTIFSSYLIMKEGDLKVGELLLNPFAITEVIIDRKDVTEAFA